MDKDGNELGAAKAIVIAIVMGILALVLIAKLVKGEML